MKGAALRSFLEEVKQWPNLKHSQDLKHFLTTDRHVLHFSGVQYGLGGHSGSCFTRGGEGSRLLCVVLNCVQGRTPTKSVDVYT